MRLVGLVSIVRVRGVLDQAAAEGLLEFAAAATTQCQAVQIHLDEVDSMTPEAAALLIHANRQPGGRTLLSADAHRRAWALTA